MESTPLLPSRTGGSESRVWDRIYSATDSGTITLSPLAVYSDGVRVWAEAEVDVEVRAGDEVLASQTAIAPSTWHEFSWSPRLVMDVEVSGSSLSSTTREVDLAHYVVAPHDHDV